MKHKIISVRADAVDIFSSERRKLRGDLIAVSEVQTALILHPAQV